MFCQNELWKPTTFISVHLGYLKSSKKPLRCLRSAYISVKEPLWHLCWGFVSASDKKHQTNLICFKIILYFHRNTTSRQWKQGKQTENEVPLSSWTEISSFMCVSVRVGEGLWSRSMNSIYCQSSPSHHRTSVFTRGRLLMAQHRLLMFRCSTFSLWPTVKH